MDGSAVQLDLMPFCRPDCSFVRSFVLEVDEPSMSHELSCL